MLWPTVISAVVACGVLKVLSSNSEVVEAHQSITIVHNCRLKWNELMR